jgi:hypothetical protein
MAAERKPGSANKMRAVAKIFVLIAFGFCASNSAPSNAADRDQSFARVIFYQNEAGRAELYLPGSAMTQKGKPELNLGDRTVDGYLAFDFTPVGKNKTMDAVRIRMGNNGNALIVDLSERGSSATIPLAGGKVAFPQRLAEEMSCNPFNKD